jgi:SAM-dependent methyltransferase
LKHYLNDSDTVVLDVGCGFEAWLLQDMVSRMELCIGLDVEVNSSLKQNNKFVFYEGDIHETIKNVPSNSVDFVSCLSILEHLKYPDTVCVEIFRILKHNGRMFFSSPTWFGKWVLENIVCSFKPLDPDGVIARQIDTHKMYYGVSNIWPILVRSGFVSTQIKLWHNNFFCSISGLCRKIT